jgi:hypothetical protein
MTTSDTFVQEFERFLETIPKDISFRQLQYDYRQVGFLMGMKVLKMFPEVLIGPPPPSLPPPWWTAVPSQQRSQQYQQQPQQQGQQQQGQQQQGQQQQQQVVGSHPAAPLGTGPGQGLGPYPHGICAFVCTIMSS